MLRLTSSSTTERNSFRIRTSRTLSYAFRLRQVIRIADSAEKLTTVATNVVNVGMTVPGIWAVDRFGRRFLLLYGAAGMAVAQIIVAAVGDARPNTDVAAQKVCPSFCPMTTGLTGLAGARRIRLHLHW